MRLKGVVIAINRINKTILIDLDDDSMNRIFFNPNTSQTITGSTKEYKNLKYLYKGAVVRINFRSKGKVVKE